MSEVTITAGRFLAAFIAAMGIPSALMGLIAWRLRTRIEARDKAAEEKAKAQQELALILVKGTRASIALGEATAKAVRRIWSSAGTCCGSW